MATADITFALDRHVPAPPGAVRTELVRALGRIGFAFVVEGVTMLEARRGSQLAAASMRSSKLPVVVRVRLSPGDPGTAVVVEMSDRWRTPVGRAWGLNGRYRAVFEEVAGVLDQALERLGGDRAAFAPGRFGSPVGDLGPLEAANAAADRAGGAVAGAADRALAGPDPRVPKQLKGLQRLELDGPPGRAVIDPGTAHGMLSVGALVASQPGAMPPNLQAQVERLTGRLEAVLLDRDARVVRLDVEADEVPVAEFLRMQALMRAALPLRVRQVCGDCRFERVVNPDYQRLAERNRKLRAVSGGVGVLVTPHGASAFALAGTLFRVAKLDPDFVCPRCQGMHCTSGIVTFCPGCGDRRDEAALRSCPRCKHDFRKDAQVTAMWHEPEPEPEPEALAGTEPHAGPDAAGTAARPPDPPPVPGSPPAGWHHDPYGRHELRWWDGTAWTAHVADGGQAGNDPYPPA